MWSIFKSKKSEDLNSKPELIPQTQAETPEIINAQPENFGTNNKPERVDNLEIRMSSLKDALDEYESKGLIMNTEAFADLFERTVGISIEDFDTQYIKNGEILMDDDIRHVFQEFERVQNNDHLETPATKSVLGHLRDSWQKGSVVKKAAFVSLLLFLKFAPQAKADDKTKVLPEDGKNKTSQTNSQTPGSGPTKTYEVTPTDLENAQLENLAQIDLTNSFATGSAEISENNEADIEQSFTNFLNEINPENFAKIMHLDFKLIASSSGEDKLGGKLLEKFPGGNKDLAQARGTSAQQILQNTLKTHDFSQSGLTVEQIKQLQNKTVTLELATSPSTGLEGERYITDLNNPATGKNYTADEVETIKANDPDLYQKLLAENRFVKLNLLAWSETEKKIEDKLTRYDNLMILFDNSSSMIDSKTYLAEQMKRMGNNKDIAHLYIGSYSNDLNYVNETADLQAAAEEIINTPSSGYSQEKSIKAAFAGLETFSDKDTSKTSEIRDAIILYTDEAIQDLSLKNLNDLKALADKKGVDVYFEIGLDNYGNRVLDLSLADLETAFKKIYDKQVKDEQKKYNTKHKALNRQLASQDIKKSEVNDIKEKIDQLNSEHEEKLLALENKTILMTKLRLQQGLATVEVDIQKID